MTGYDCEYVIALHPEDGFAVFCLAAQVCPVIHALLLQGARFAELGECFFPRVRKHEKGKVPGWMEVPYLDGGFARTGALPRAHKGAPPGLQVRHIHFYFQSFAHFLGDMADVGADHLQRRMLCFRVVGEELEKRRPGKSELKTGAGRPTS